MPSVGMTRNQVWLKIKGDQFIKRRPSDLDLACVIASVSYYSDEMHARSQCK